MRILYNLLRGISNVALVNKPKALCISLQTACFIRSLYFYNTPISRAYCTLFECWPSNLPPATEWGYDKPGPETWPSKYPPAGGKNQSPIDIVSSSVKPGEFEAPLRWKYSPEICKSIINTGCGWRVDVEGTNTELSGGPLSNSYQLSQFHAHWGDCNTCGSEHTVDGKCYSGELHFVHWNKEEFSSISEAVCSPKGLSVIAVFLEVDEKNSEIDKLCDVIASIPRKDQQVKLEEVNVDPVLMYPADNDYWTYIGSLTTPPCYESVTWIVFKNPITVSEEQLECFRRMKKPSTSEDEDCGRLERNNPQSFALYYIRL